jgi:hypothetical protein
MADKNSPERRRRSSSILQVYHEPPETLEQINDQAALPNLNANWTNAKGNNNNNPSYPLESFTTLGIANNSFQSQNSQC